MKTKPARKTKPAKSAAIVQVMPAAEKPWLLSQEEITIVKNSIAKGASDEELKFCLTVARRYRLDPFKQQIWFVSRWSKDADNGNGGKGAHVWTPQVGINGLLFAAARDHKQDLGSVSLPEYGPMVLVEGQGKMKAPEWARVKVWKKGASEPTEAEAWWDEYAPADLSKAPFWRKMPRRMLAKCATALAIKQAYPDLGGLYIPEECDRIAEDHTPSGRQIVENIPQPSREVTQEQLKQYESLSVTPWKEGRVALSGNGLAIIKAEFSPEVIAEFDIKHNIKEKVTHMKASEVFKLKDRAEKLNVDVNLDYPNQSIPSANTEPVQGSLM